jgi:IclR family transcriptional regulator, pca regulon regulatory protein
MNGTYSPLFIQSLATGLEVLLAFNAERTAMNLPEIAEASGITKSAAQRFAFTLEALGFLRRDPATKRYSLDPRTLNFGYHYLLSSPLIARANPYLLELNRRSRETVNLSEPCGVEMVVIARFPSPEHSIVHMPIGRRLPMFCTASGRAYLSALPENEARAILKASDRIRMTPTTVTDLGRLMALVAEAREHGFAYANQEYYRGDLNLAVPLLNVSGRPIAAMNLSAATSRWTMEKLREQMVPMLIETARLISTTPPTPSALEPFQRGYGVEVSPPKRKAKSA